MLTQRQEIILKTLIELYQKQKEPISSRMLAHQKLNVSSATIRNELLFLDRIAFVKKVHASSGRIPSEAGYKYYLTHLLKEDHLSYSIKQHICQRMQEEIPYSKFYWQHFVNLLSELTECVAFVSYPRLFGQFQSFQLVPLTKEKWMIWLTTQEQGIVSCVISSHEYSSLSQFTYHLATLNQVLYGTAMSRLSYVLSEALPYVLPIAQQEQQQYKNILQKLIAQAVDERFIVSGYHYLYQISELSEELREYLIQQLEEYLLFPHQLPEGSDQRYTIHLSSEWLNNITVPLSYIQMPYCLSNASFGRMMILGSASMDYEYHIAIMKYMCYELNQQYYI